MRVPPAREATAASDRRYSAPRIRQTAASDRRYSAPRIRETAANDRRYSAPRFCISSSSFLVSCVLQSCVFSHFSFQLIFLRASALSPSSLHRGLKPED